MKPVPKRPIDYVRPPLNRAREARMWAVVERAQAPRSRRGLGLAAALAAAVLVLVVVRAWPTSSLPLARGERIVTAGESTTLQLPDGSNLTVAETSTLRVVQAASHAVELQLERGRVSCDVSKKPRERFWVHAHDVTVMVRGTRFSVRAVANGDVMVGVEHGKVEVHERGQLVATLQAGQSWSRRLEGHASDAQRAQPAEAVAQTAPDAETRVPEAEEGADAQPRETDEPAAAERRASSRRRTRDADGASALFERAQQARLEGRAALAADAYDALRTRHPHDPRAGLAAFELARISQHVLHDPARALAALGFARKRASAAFAREDVDALEVDALGALGRSGECQRAREAFVSLYPKSAHLSRLERACRSH